MMQRQYPNAVREVPARRPYKDLLARITGEEVPYYTEHLMNDRYNEFWKSDSRTDAADNITFPVLFVEGWYDFYLEGMFDMWHRLPERTREQSVFWVGPWGHAVPTVPQEDPRFPGSALPEDYAAVWFDSIRANVPYPYAQTGKVNYYAPGENRRCVREFPATAEFRRLYLSADSALVGDSAVPGARTFCADPDNAPACFAKGAFAEAFAPDSQPDVLSFVGKPFQQEQHFFGAVRLHMEVSSDCDDTAFYFRLYLTGPDGESHYLTETIAALRFLHPDYRAGDVVCLELETPPMAFSVPTGHTVRLDLAFCGGAYVPHANVAGHWAEVTETRIAHNTVFCGNSFVELPQKTQE